MKELLLELGDLWFRLRLRLGLVTVCSGCETCDEKPDSTWMDAQ